MCPRTKEQFDLIRRKSKAKIMETALELFGRYGYQSTVVSKIATEAGVSKGLIYNYFDGKEALLKEILVQHITESIDWWQEIFQGDLPPIEKIRQSTMRAADKIRNDLHHWQLLTALTFQQDVLKIVEEEVQEMHAKVITQTTKLFEEAGAEDPFKEAMLYGAFVDGMFLHYINMPDDYPLDEMIDFFFKRYSALQR